MAGERSKATEFASSGVMKSYSTSQYGLKSFIDRADLEFLDRPFKLWERRKTEEPVGKLEPAREKRIAAAAVQGLSGRSIAPSTKRSSGAGNPHADIFP